MEKLTIARTKNGSKKGVTKKGVTPIFIAF